MNPGSHYRCGKIDSSPRKLRVSGAGRATGRHGEVVVVRLIIRRACAARTLKTSSQVIRSRYVARLRGLKSGLGETGGGREVLVESWKVGKEEKEESWLKVG